MLRVLERYTLWLHTCWPAGSVEKLPVVDLAGRATLPGVYIVGDLTGIPLLKFSAHSGARAIRSIAADPFMAQRRRPERDGLDVAIVGCGVAGAAAALEAQVVGLRFEVYEATRPFATIVNFPKAKPIYAYPTAMKPDGQLRFSAEVKEDLVAELDTQRRDAGIEPRYGRVHRIERSGDRIRLVDGQGVEMARAYRVVVAIGRSGNHRKMKVPGEDLGKVYNRLHDPYEFTGQQVMVVGGGDSAAEAAVALACAGSHVILSYRGSAFTRPKPENVERITRLATDPGADVAIEHPTSERVTTALSVAAVGVSPRGSLRLALNTEVARIDEQSVTLREQDNGATREHPNDVVFSMIGREPPLDFFRRSRMAIRGEWRPGTWAGLLAVLLAAAFVYHWKTDAGIPVYDWFRTAGWFPFYLTAPGDPSTFWGTIRLSMQTPSFYYSLAYCLAVIVFGIARIRRRQTAYVRRQTLTLTVIQVIPLFLLPYALLPWAGHNGWFDTGLGQALADALFPLTPWDVHGREYWRSVGFILAWPLMFWNVFTHQPIATWLIISLVQTFVVIPLIVWRWGKGAYCGWICSCGALAETVGDTLRHKMPHGPRWNRLNMLGQVVLGGALILLGLRLISWWAPEGGAVANWTGAAYMAILLGKTTGWANLPFPLTFLNYNWIVDVTFAGILGVGLYVHFSGRVWCRFACPLAAIMHIYARFTRFRIFADKSKCISCNVCTSVCHQGIDVMNFANKAMPMQDPQCVRCSACVQSCPTGVLTFGRVDAKGKPVFDRLIASPVQGLETRTEKRHSRP